MEKYFEFSIPYPWIPISTSTPLFRFIPLFQQKNLLPSQVTQFCEGPTPPSPTPLIITGGGWGVGGGGFNCEEVPEFMILKIHKMFKYACIILLFLFKGENANEVTLGISQAIYGKKKVV